MEDTPPHALDTALEIELVSVLATSTVADESAAADPPPQLPAAFCLLVSTRALAIFCKFQTK